MKKLINCFILIGFLSGCGSLGHKFENNITPKQDEVLIYYYRPSHFVGGAVYYDVKENGETFASQYGLVIIDECHHIAADEARTTIRNLNAKYVYGLTATPKRGDGLERIEYAECGNIIFRYEAYSI